MAKAVSRSGVGSARKQRVRTTDLHFSATVGRCPTELLERRLLLSAVSSTHELLAGPVASAATAVWYQQRVAALQGIRSSNQAEPAYALRLSTDASPSQTASPDPAGFTPAQIKTYYGFTGLSFGSKVANGQGQTIAVVEAYDDPDITADLKTFDTAYGLAAPPSFEVVSQTGSTTQLPSVDIADPENGSWAAEESLDVEWAHALAPGADIMVVECDSQNDSDLYAGVAYAASAPAVSVVSMSFGESETNYTQAELAAIDPTFVTPPGHQGVTFLASSGDQGAYSDDGPLAVSFPSSSPGVVSVGGTTLLTNTSGTPTGETAWTGSGGGVSTLEPQTAAQKSAVGSYSGRANPDVSFDADPDSGVNICDSLDFSAATPFLVIGGTSFSSPAWGSILAITNQGRVIAGKPTLDGRQQTIPALYSAYTNGSYSSVFKDVTTGSNGFYNAGKGFDLTTGLGSPIVKNLVPELATNTVHSTPPVIGTLSVSPAVEDAGTAITLTASNITDTVGDISGVNFYRISGSISTLIGAGVVNALGNWSLSLNTSNLAVGTYTYAAVATNNYKQSSARVSASNKVVIGQATPTIGSFIVQPGAVPVGMNITMIATGVADTTGPVASVAFYLDTGTTPTLIGLGSNGGYGRWTFTTSTSDFVPGQYRFIAIATAASGLVSASFRAIDTVKVGPPINVVVNTTKDQTDARGSSTVSLRDAIAIANRGIGQVTIEFDPKVFGSFQTIDLTGATLSLTDTAAATIIDGPSEGVAISGGGNIQVFSINPLADVSMSNLTITDGASGGSGGGLTNAGVTTLTNVTISDNTDSGLVGNGGGIENDGTLNLIDSVITGNSTDNGNGGGLYNTGKLTATDTTISDNTAFNGGGAGSDGTMTLTQSEISGNTALETGGGIDNLATLTLVSSTVSGNTAFNAGGLYTGPVYTGVASALATVVNSTIAANTATYANGGILNGFGGNLIISDSTVTRNSAGDSYGGLDSTGNAAIANSIIADNTVGGASLQGVDASGVIISKGHNLIGQTDGSSGWVKSDFTGTSSTPLDAHLSPLGNFGGVVETMVPLVGSEALGHGSTSLIPAAITTDERGFARIVSGKVDIGAVEVQGVSSLKLTAAAAQSAVANQTATFKLGSFTDSSGHANQYSVVIDWGDGTPDTDLTLKTAGAIPVVSHTFANASDIEVSVLVGDAAGAVSNLTTFKVTVAPPPPETLVVNSTADDIDDADSTVLTLRDAISDANNYQGQVTIKFDPTVFASHRTITLGGADLELLNAYALVTIAGPTAGLTISGGGLSDVLFIYSGVTASLSNVTITDANDVYAGGITNQGTLNIVDSTISGNTATGNGAGIDNFGTLTMVNSTLANNKSISLASYPGTPDGGGLYNADLATLTNVTISGNSSFYGGGVDNVGTLTIANTIIAGNSVVSGSAGSDVGGSVTSQGHNLIGKTDGSTGWISSDFTGTVANPLNAHLSSLGNNGGPTQTMLPLTASKAINNGSVSLIPRGITTDQRGKPRTINGKVDIGATEAG